jgi:transposase
LPCPSLLRLNSYEMDLERHAITLSVSSTQSAANCPLCGDLSERVHSRYQRTLSDLPCLHFSMILLVEVCKFFCPNPECYRRIFTERIPEVVAPWARKTVRQVQQLQEIALALGGAAGSRLGKHLGYASCGTTLLNHLQRLPLPAIETPKILGVDDFAFRKGHNYGTILVNLETHQPLALLADRKADTLADWLREHPGVEMLSRDRSKTYKSAMNKAAPEAIQVADRFHLVKNLSEALELALGSYPAELKATSQAQRPDTTTDEHTETVVVIPQATATATATSQEQTKKHYQQRVQQQREVKALRAQRWPTAAIAQKVGVSERTVLRFSKLPDFSETQTRRPTFGRSLLDPYKQAVLAWWNSGVMNSKVLMISLRQKGYNGSLRTLQRYIRGLRKAQGIPCTRGQVAKDLPTVIDPQSPPFTPRQAAYLIVQREENRKLEEQELLEYLVKQHSDLATLVDLAHMFLELLRQRQADAFDSWLMKVLACPIQALKKFASGLMDDYAAVKASMMMEFSNGSVEGLNNKLKMLKRQMFGRAGLTLLSKRLIMAS